MAKKVSSWVTSYVFPSRGRPLILGTILPDEVIEGLEIPKIAGRISGLIWTSTPEGFLVAKDTKLERLQQKTEEFSRRRRAPLEKKKG